MSVIQKLKEASLRIRRDGGKLSAFCSFVLAEIEKVGKNNGNRPTTEDEAIKVMQKIIIVNEKMVDIISDSDRMTILKAENDLLKGMLPTMVTKDEIVAFLNDTFGPAHPTNRGEAMNYLREEFGSRVDMREASTIVMELYFSDK